LVCFIQPSPSGRLDPGRAEMSGSLQTAIRSTVGK